MHGLTAARNSMIAYDTSSFTHQNAFETMTIQSQSEGNWSMPDGIHYTVRRIEIRTPFSLNLRQFAMIHLKNHMTEKRLEKKMKQMALVPSKLTHSLDSMKSGK